MVSIPPPQDVGRPTPRRDVSGVEPQDGGTTRHCALAVQYRQFPPDGSGPPPPPSDLDRLRAHERDRRVEAIHERLTDLHPDGMVVGPAAEVADQIAATVAAMARAAPIVIGGRLPTDRTGRRRGMPVVLVRAERRPDGCWAYHPVEIRDHRTLDVVHGEPEPGAGALTATLASPALVRADVDPGHRTRANQGDRLWLAHSHRMLERTAHASSTAAGAVIGTEGLVVWHHLDVQVVQRRWDLPHATLESVLSRYDREFSFRLDVLAAAATGDPIVGPVAVGECARCPWRPHCWPRIEAADSTSLLPGFGYRQWYNLATADITTRAQVADLDEATAALRDALGSPVRLDALVAAAHHAAPSAPIVELAGSVLIDAAASSAEDTEDGVAPLPVATDLPGHEVPHQEDTDQEEPDDTAALIARILARLDVHTGADLLTLDPLVVSLSSQPVARLAEAIANARAQASGRPQLRRGHDQLVVPVADVEIDIDMESSFDGTTYLWGAWADHQYHAAVSWAEPSPVVGGTVFLEFWEWLTARRQGAYRAGQTVVAYCWFRGAEAQALRAGAAAAAAHLDRPGASDEVEAFLASAEFVDLYEVFTRQLLTGTSAGLKTIASMAGFAWRDHDPSGADSMAWHDHAVGHPDQAEREDARRRLLAYNEDDVRATAAVRRWMLRDLGGRASAPEPGPA